MKVLYIGTGPNWQEQKKQLLTGNPDGEYVGIDILPSFQPDIVRDVLRGLPFDSDSFDSIIIEHVLEHISGALACEPNDNYSFVMNEIHRVLKPGGIATIEVPYWRDDCAVESAGHIRLFAENSFINFYANPYWQEMGLCCFSECLFLKVYETGRSGNLPARAVRVQLKK